MAALFLLSLLVALGAIFGPAALVEEADASRVGLYAQDYEGALCGLVTGPNGRDLTSRPYAYFLNASHSICVAQCPRLADELACEYALEAAPPAARYKAIGTRCFAQQRTRPAFPACLPLRGDR